MPTHVMRLRTIHYPPSGVTENGRDWEAIESSQPTWDDIEQAIRRLDRDEWPMIWMHKSDDCSDDPLDDAFQIMGGRGEWAMCYLLDGDETHCRFESRGTKKVRIWESDQGSIQTERDLCSDLNLVLEVAKHFARHGTLLPTIQWVHW